MADAAPRRDPWAYVPALYVLQGMPYFVVQAAANTFLAAMGAPTGLVGRVSSDLTLPWMLKPVWSPLVDLFGTKRGWLLRSALGVLACTLLVAWAAQTGAWLSWTIAACAALAVCSATFDVACDGYYMLALGRRDQEGFVGVRSTCYRLGRLLVTGGVVALAGMLQGVPGEHALARGLGRGQAWALAFCAGAALYALGLAWCAWALPRPAGDGPLPRAGTRAPLLEMLRSFVARPRFVGLLAFILFYRFAEALLTPMIAPFLIQPAEQGGLALSEAEVGWIYGTLGVLAVLVGGLAGGWLIARAGLARAIWPMAIAMHLPNLAFAWAAHARPGPSVLSVLVGAEQLGYGFGLSAYMVVLLQNSRGSRSATTHYALATGLMALSGWLAGRWSGELVEALGYERFFWLVCALGPLGLATIPLLPREQAPDQGPSDGPRDGSG
jgi:PAT family beta-lactamase induction signal transducer AmpG